MRAGEDQYNHQLVDCQVGSSQKVTGTHGYVLHIFTLDLEANILEFGLYSSEESGTR